MSSLPIHIEPDPIDAFKHAIAQTGLRVPEEIIPDGDLHRFPSGEKSDLAGWYVFYPEAPAAGAFGCWRQGFSEAWCAKSRDEFTKEERSQFVRKMKEVEKARERDKAQIHANARARANEVWGKSPPANPAHPYLVAKSVAPHGIRQSGDGLVVPLCGGDDVLHGLQFIAPDGAKRFLTGTLKKGNFFLIGDQPSSQLVICEGFATGASVHEALGIPVAVAFDAGNLKPVAMASRHKWPHAKLTIAGDHDVSGVGQGKALETAQEVGASVAIPETPGDWNDVANSSGQAAIKAAFDALPSTTAPIKPKLPPGFAIRKNGLWFDDAGDPDKPATMICGPIDVLAETRDAEGCSWGVLLEWRDNDGQPHQWAMPRALLAGDGADVRRALLDGGLTVYPTKRARDLLNSFLGSVRIDARATAVNRIGWHGEAYVLPDETIGAVNGERILLQTGSSFEHAFRASGSLGEWKDSVAAYAVGNSRLILAISTGLAASAIECLDAESGGFHFRGASSTGKSTALYAAGSVWGGGDVGGYIRSWRLTGNGLEGMAAGHCDALLCLDELGQVAAKEAGEVAYMLGNGSGKARANRDGNARKAARWRLLFLSTGEIGLADKVAEDGRGRKAAAGQQVRVIDIAADAGAGIGLFENLHGFDSGDTFSRTLKSNASKFYGTAARAMIQVLAKEKENTRVALKGFTEEFVTNHCPKGADGQVSRVAQRFGLVAGAGELAAKLGIVPWPAGEAERGISRCFKDWLDARGGIEPAEVRGGIAQVRQFLEQHGDSRFARWEDPADVMAGDDRRTFNRAGYRRSADGDTEFFIFPETWRSEVCAGFDAQMVARALAERGALVPDADGKMSSRHRPKGHKNVARFYRITAQVFRGDGDE